MDCTTEKSQVPRIARQLTKLMMDRDLVKLNLILDKDFTLTYIKGYVQSRQEWLKAIESHNMKYYS